MEREGLKFNSYKNPLVLGADFETDITDDGSRRFVCQWAISPGDDFPEGGHPFAWTGKDLESFEKTLRKIQTKDRHILIYFHNLPYDASYMLELLNDIPDWGFDPFYAVNNGDPIIVSFTKGDAKKPSESIVFRDSHRKLNNSLKEIGRMLGYDKLMAPDSEFTPGWSKNLDYEHTKYTDPDWVYVCMDAWICCRAMRQLHEGFDGIKFDRPTFSGDAYNNCKKYVNGVQTKRNRFGTNETKWERLFPPLPVFDLDEEGSVIVPDTDEEYETLVGKDRVTDNEIRQAYWGGINYSAHKGLNSPKMGKKVFHIDYHSMYPSQMKYRLLPYGRCIEVMDISEYLPEHEPEMYDPECMVYVAQLFVTKMKLKEGRIPWYHMRNAIDNIIEGMDKSDSVTELKHHHILTVSSVELHDMLEYYDMEFSPVMTEEYAEDGHLDYDPDWHPQAWIYMAQVGVLGGYIDYWYGIKQQEETDGRKGGLRYNWSKVMMNSVYGRIAMSPYQQETTIEWNPNIGWYDWKRLNRKIANGWEAYIPYPVFVCAWARHQLLDAWLKVGCENVIHSDTDSIIFYGDAMPKDLRVTGHTDEYSFSELDTWGNECPTETKDGYEDMDGSTIVALYEGGTKRYIEIVKPLKGFKVRDKLSKYVHMAMAGVPQKTFETTDGIQYPIGMWIELLDAPGRIYETDDKGEPITLGHAHYHIGSQWLRDLYEAIGLNPDDVNTMKKARHKMCGGMDIVDTTFKLNSGYRMVFR